MNDANQTPEQQMTARTRRSFLTMGVAAAAGFGGWRWLRSRPAEGNLAWPFRRVLQANEKLAEGYFSPSHRVPTYSKSAAPANTRVNGDIGLDGDFDPGQWRLSLQRLRRNQPESLPFAAIRALPRVEQVTQLNCIEGWTAIVHWAGVRFADFTERFAPESAHARYIYMETPDQEYFVGLDTPSALHPQTLLCYEMNGEPLTPAHGAPLRLVIPVKYGVKNIKRIGTIRYTDERPDDYWAQEGYDWFAGL